MSSVPKYAFGHVLKELRERSQFTQKDLAIRAGCVSSHVSLIENGLRVPRQGTVRAFSEQMSLGPNQDVIFHAAYAYNPQLVDPWEAEGISYLVKIGEIYDMGYERNMKKIRDRIRAKKLIAEAEDTTSGIVEMFIDYFRQDDGRRKQIYETLKAICNEEFKDF